MFRKALFGVVAVVAAVLFCVGCDAEESEACDYGAATTFSIVQPQQVYTQAFAQPVYVQPFVQQRVVQRQFVQSYAVQPQAVIVQEQRFRQRDRGRSRQRVIVRQNLRY